MKLSYALSCLLLAAGITTSAVADECSLPAAPALPDGKTATEEQMIGGQKAVKDFMATTDTYLACIEKAEAQVKKEEMTPERQQDYVQRYNSAVDVMEGVAAQFNQAVRDYKAANSAN